MNFRPLATIIMVLTGLLVFGPVANAGPVAIVGGGYNLGGAFSTLDVLSVDVLTLATSSLLTGLPSPAVGVAVGDGKLFTSDGTIVTVRLNPGGGPPTFVDDFDLPSLGDGWVYYDLSYWAGSLFAVADLVDQGLILQLDPSTGDIVSAWDLSHRITSLEIGSSLTGCRWFEQRLLGCARSVEPGTPQRERSFRARAGYWRSSHGHRHGR
jgi:hypothetical protein